MDQATDLAMQAGVQLESLAQAHLFGQGNHQVAIIALGQLLGQGVSQYFGPAAYAGRANPGFARVRHRHVDVTVRAVEQREAIARVTATHQSFHDLLGLFGKGTVALFVTGVVGSEELLPMVDQNPPQGTLMELSLTIQRSLATERHPSGLSDFRRQKVDWVRLKHGQSNSLDGSLTCLSGLGRGGPGPGLGGFSGARLQCGDHPRRQVFRLPNKRLPCWKTRWCCAPCIGLYGSRRTEAFRFGSA